MKNYTLGLDMGVASIGWACVSEEEQKLDSGVRVFPAGVDAFNSSKEKHANLDRRDARGMRRRVRRKARRKALIKKYLQELGWMPEPGDSAYEAWLQQDVYALRSKAIKEKVSLAEIGRILLHLNQRRGFLSLRKKDEANANKETTGMLGEMSALQKEIDKGGFKTLGNYLHHLYESDQHITPLGKVAKIQKIRGRHIRRSMLYDEFALIWETQAQYHSELTEVLRYGTHGKEAKPIAVRENQAREKGVNLLQQFGLENLTFFQRKVYWPSSSIGRCEWEYDQRRAPMADRRFQQFRLLQVVNDLRLLDSSSARRPVERKLSKEERKAALNYLEGKKEASLDDLKKNLIKQKDLKENLPESVEQLSFSIEQGGRKKILATATDHLLASSKGLGGVWKKLSEREKNVIVEILTNPDLTDDDIYEQLTEKTELSGEQATKLLTVSLSTGYCHVSVKFLEKVLPYMREGMSYMGKDKTNSAVHAADPNYRRRDEEQAKVLESLPPFEFVTREGSQFYNPHQTVILNPVVLRSLTELRKVVNALIKKHGKPTRIHLEMARELKMSPKQRQEYQTKTNKLKKQREDAAKEIEKLGYIANRDAIEMYRLWKEQDELCIYSGEVIGLDRLFAGGVDVDHIYPYSKSADNSYFNKVVCLARENREKGNQLPYTWLAHSDPEKYESILQRAKKLERGKYKRFIADSIPEGFVARDLNDTAWMTKAARMYLGSILENPSRDIVCLKGAHTATLRRQWGLHSLLRHDDIDKKLRDDHRHHALDAIVIALCTRSRIQEITKRLKHEVISDRAREEGKRIYRLKQQGEKLTQPWQNFRLEVCASLNSIWVSHRAKRKVSGPLHKETTYGKTAEGLLTTRKCISTLTTNDLKHIRDKGTKDLISAYKNENGGDIGALKQLSKDNPLLMSSGVPVYKATIAFPYAHITLREGTDHEAHLQSASTHHLAIFSLGNGKFHFEPVNLMEATRRLRRNEDLVQHHYEDMPPEAELLFHLCQGDSLMAEIEGRERLFVFRTMASTTKQVKFALHTDATKGNKDERGKSTFRTCMEGSFAKNFPKARKVTILPDGSVRDCSL